MRSLTRSETFYDTLPVPVRAADGVDAISPPDDPSTESAAPTATGEFTAHQMKLVGGCVHCARMFATRRLIAGVK